MKKLHILIIVFVCFFLFLSATCMAKKGNSNLPQEQTITQQAVHETVYEAVYEDTNNSKNQERNRERKEAHQQWKDKKDALEVEKDALKQQLKELEAKIKAAEAAGDKELEIQLKKELAVFKVDFEVKKDEIKQAKKEIKAEFKKMIKDKANKYEIIDGDKIKIKGKKFDADTPPVIREGRTLIPLRAIANALGAEVKYDASTKQVTITRDSTVIIIDTVKNITTVNGKEVTTDTKCDNLANRTYVPFRFVATTLGDKVNYDNATGEITIGE